LQYAWRKFLERRKYLEDLQIGFVLILERCRRRYGNLSLRVKSIEILGEKVNFFSWSPAYFVQ
jgi:hypothetical protein